MEPACEKRICKVLIVDDSEFMRDVLDNMLRYLGFRVVAEAVDGCEAVEKYAQVCPDVTIMDLNMPRKDGLRATCDILRFDRAARIILCSGEECAALEKLAANTGAKSVLHKPYKVEEICQAIHQALAA